jgi:hypothetical protein
VWNEEFSSTMISLGFTQLKTDYCCFIRRENGLFTIVIVWVDDILSFSISDAENNCIELELKSKFEVNSIGRPSMILGIKLAQNNHLISLSQSHFVESLLNKFGLENANPVSTPLNPNVNLDDDDPIESSKEQGKARLTSFTLICNTYWFIDVFINRNTPRHRLFSQPTSAIYSES